MYQILIFNRIDFKVIFIGVSIGGIIQYFCWRYVKNNPQMFEEFENEKKPVKDKRSPSTPSIPYGGAIVEVTGIKIVINVGKLILLLSKHAAMIGFSTGAGFVVVKKFPIKQISRTVRSLTRSSKGVPIPVGDVDILKNCSNWNYVINILSDKDIPYHDRRKKAFTILRHQLTIESKADVIRYITCLVSAFTLFTLLRDTSSVFLLMENLIKSVKEGKISKRLARLILRKLLRQGVEVDPEFTQLVNS